MKPFPFLASGALLCVVFLPLATPSCGGSTSTPPTETGGGSGGSAGTSGTSGAAGSNNTGTGASGTSVTGGAGSTQQGGAAGTSVTSTDTCMTTDDCAWGEVSKEILSAADCPCLYGCVYLPQTKATATRRGEQYKALCTPRMNGMGQPCGIDDCAVPGAIACVDGTCKAAPRDGGMRQ